MTTGVTTFGPMQNNLTIEIVSDKYVEVANDVFGLDCDVWSVWVFWEILMLDFGLFGLQDLVRALRFSLILLFGFFKLRDAVFFGS